MSKINFYDNEELDSAIEADGAILASVATIEEIQAAGKDVDVYDDILHRMIAAGGGDDHSGASFWAVRTVAYFLLKEGQS